MVIVAKVVMDHRECICIWGKNQIRDMIRNLASQDIVIGKIKFRKRDWTVETFHSRSNSYQIDFLSSLGSKMNKFTHKECKVT